MLTDKQDYEEIYQKYKNLVMKAAYKYSGNYDIAEDITQSTFLQLYMYIEIERYQYQSLDVYDCKAYGIEL